MINVEGLAEINVEKGGKMVEGRIEELKSELERLKKEDKVKKNQKPGKPDPNRKYVLLSETLKSWGRVPQQQADVAKLLSSSMAISIEYSEAGVFNILTENADQYQSLRDSIQDPTYIFRFYRGMKNDGKRAGFVARAFIRVIG